MRQIWKPFRALYFASLMMLIGSGLLSTYLALRLAADHVDSLWVGALMAPTIAAWCWVARSATG
jgi:hypothetical protein